MTLSDVPFIVSVHAAKSLQNRHHGQRKLLLVEIQLLTKVIENQRKFGDERPILMIYAGAAPCMHFGKLMELFPQVKFLLVDPNEFLIFVNQELLYKNNDPRIVYLESHSHDDYELPGIKKMIRGIDGQLYDKKRMKFFDNPDIIVDHIYESQEQAYIIENYFTNELATALKNDKFYTVFMSDIRTNSLDDSDKNGNPREIDVLWNTAQMFNWTCLMEPDCISHKHRVIYLNTELGIPADYMNDDFELSKTFGIDFVENIKKCKFAFFAGTEYLQPWISRGSSETRLICFRADMKEIEDDDKDNGMDWICPGPTINRSDRYLNFSDDYVPKVTKPFIIPGVPLGMKWYDLIEYDQKMLYHNRVNKTCQGYYSESPVDSCYDCALETQVFKEYNSLNFDGLRPLDIKKEMETLHLSLGSRSGHPEEFHRIEELHGRTGQVKRISKSSNPKYVRDRFKET